MALVVPKRSQKPYRFGMSLLCVGALFNWLALADGPADPVPILRYVGVSLIAAGAVLICIAMCFWMRMVHGQPINPTNARLEVRIIQSIESEKPPEYYSVKNAAPPRYEEALKLYPELLLHPTHLETHHQQIRSLSANSVRPTSSQASQTVPIHVGRSFCSVSSESEVNPISHSNRRCKSYDLGRLRRHFKIQNSDPPPPSGDSENLK